MDYEAAFVYTSSIKKIYRLSRCYFEVVFWLIEIDDYLFGISCSSHDNGWKIGISLFVQNTRLRTNFLKSNLEENIDVENQYRLKSLEDPIDIREAVLKKDVDTFFNSPSLK